MREVMGPASLLSAHRGARCRAGAARGAWPGGRAARCAGLRGLASLAALLLGGCIGDPPVPLEDLAGGAAGSAAGGGPGGASGASGQGGVAGAGASGASGQGGAGASGASGQAGDSGQGGAGAAGEGGAAGSAGAAGDAGAGQGGGGQGGAGVAGQGGAGQGGGGQGGAGEGGAGQAGAGSNGSGAGGDAGAGVGGGGQGGAGEGGGGQGGASGGGQGGGGQGGAGAGGAGQGGAGISGSSGQGGAGVSGSSGQGGAGEGGAGQSGASGSAGQPGCGPGETLCSGACVDTQRDEANCGACGQPCSNLCVEGTCDQILELKVGSAHSCARFSSGKVRCWGLNTSGQLGIGSTTSVGTQGHAGVATPLTQATALGLGASTTCVIASDKLYCWGDNGQCQLGLGKGSSPVGGEPSFLQGSLVALGSGKPTAVATSDFETCTLIQGGSVRCWGATGGGRLGNSQADEVFGACRGDTEKPTTNLYDAALGGLATQAAVSSGHACAVLTSGAVRCWGNNSKGQLGLVSTEPFVGDNEEPSSQSALAFTEPAVQVVAAGSSTCARLADGSVHCWGANNSGQLGLGNGNSAPLWNTGDASFEAETRVPLGADAVQIAGAGETFCALFADGGVLCWGDNGSGKLGQVSTKVNLGLTEDLAALPRIALGGAASQVSVGSQHVCALLLSGNVRCWGLRLQGRLGYPAAEDIGATQPPSVAEEVFLSLARGLYRPTSVAHTLRPCAPLPCAAGSWC